MKKFATILVVGLALTLTGCAPSQGSDSEETDTYTTNQLGVGTITLPDGREVTCVTAGGGSGIDCDWENAE